MTNKLSLAILPGDGIGMEITQPCVELIQPGAGSGRGTGGGRKLA